MNASAIAKQCRQIATASTKAASTVPEKDPTLAGTPTAPNHPDGDNNAKTGIPAQSKPKNEDKPTDLPGAHDTKPSGGGENAPAVSKTVTATGSEPDTKAASVAALGASLRQMASAGHKAASAPAAAPAADKSTDGGAAPAGLPAVAGADKPKDGDKKKDDKDSKKEAAAADMPADMRGIFSKIASELYATEEGRATLSAHLERKLGAKAASDLLQTAAEQHAFETEQMAKFAAEQEATDHLGRVLLHSLTKRASAKRDGAWFKMATAVHAEQIDALPHPLLKAAYMQGVDDAGATTSGAAEGEAPAPLPGAEGQELPPEEIQMMLQQMVDSGEITPEEAEALFAEITGGGAAGGGGGAAPEGGAAPAEEPLPADAPPEAKAASAVVRTLTKLASFQATRAATPAK